MVEQTLTNNGHCINLYRWEIDEPKANIFVAHGLGEHGGRYEHFAIHFNQLGYNVYALDHQGHGKSFGKKGHISDFQEYSDDLKFVIEQNTQEGLKNILLGHSLGGVIACGFLIRNPNLITTSIISAPGFEKKIPPTAAIAFIGKLLANIFPTLSLSNEIEVEGISRSKKIVDDYINDPLVHDRVTAKFFTSFLAEFEFIKAKISEIKTPVLMLLPGSDLIVDHAVSKEMFERISSENKKLVEYPASYHEVLNEDKERFEAYDEIKQWLDK